MRTTIRGLRRIIAEAIMADVKPRPRKKGEDETKRDVSSDIGVKNKPVNLKAGTAVAKRIEPELIDMINTTYAPVGGNPKVNTPGDLSHEYSDWVVGDTDDDPDVDAIVAGKPEGSKMKLGLSATDGTPQAKSFMMRLKKQLLNNGWWAETSDAPAHIALNKLGIKPVEDEDKVRALLGGKKIEWHGKHPEGKFPGTYGWYSRDIGGKMHAKIIVGDV